MLEVCILCRLARLVACSTAIACATRFSDTSAGSINYTVSNCAFNNLAQTGSSVNGGALCISVSSSYTLSISYALFSNCTSAAAGGALYFTGGYLIINNTCARSCAATADGQFFYITASVHISVYSTSYYKCAPTTTSHVRDSIYVGGGVGDITRINSTLNCVNTYGASSFCTVSTADTILFANVVNNTGSGSVVDYYAVTQLAVLSYSNILYNKDSANNGIVLSTYYLSLSFNVFIGNTGTYLCHAQGSVMFISSCWIAHSATIAYGAIVTAGCYTLTTGTLNLGECGCESKSNSFTFFVTAKYTNAYYLAALMFCYE